MNDRPWNALKIVEHLDTLPSGIPVRDLAHRLGLRVTYFTDQEATGFESKRCLEEKSSIEGQAVRGIGEGNSRLPLSHFALQTGHLSFGNVGRIRDNEVRDRSGRDRCEKVSLKEGHPVADCTSDCVAPRDGQGGPRNVIRDDERIGKLPGQRNGEATGAGTDINNHKFGQRLREISGNADDPFDNQLTRASE